MSVQKGMRGKSFRAGRIPRVSADGRPYPPPLLHRCCQERGSYADPGEAGSSGMLRGSLRRPEFAARDQLWISVREGQAIEAPA
jgi:hypothetical protein